APARDGLLRTARLQGDAHRSAQLLLAEAEAAQGRADRSALVALAAAALAQKGDFAAAAAYYKSALELFPSDLLEDARRRMLRRAGDLGALTQAALDELKQASDPARKARAYLRLAEIDSLDRGDAASAALAYESLLELEPGHPGGLRALESYFLIGERDAELVELYGQLSRALRGDPTVDVAVHLTRARLRGKTEGLAAMLDDAEAAIAHDPHCVPALLTLIDDARERRDLERTLALYLRLSDALSDDPRSAAACLLRVGDALAGLGRDDEALERYR